MNKSANIPVSRFFFLSSCYCYVVDDSHSRVSRTPTSSGRHVVPDFGRFRLPAPVSGVHRCAGRAASPAAGAGRSVLRAGRRVECRLDAASCHGLHRVVGVRGCVAARTLRAGPESENGINKTYLDVAWMTSLTTLQKHNNFFFSFSCRRSCAHTTATVHRRAFHRHTWFARRLTLHWRLTLGRVLRKKKSICGSLFVQNHCICTHLGSRPPATGALLINGTPRLPLQNHRRQLGPRVAHAGARINHCEDKV